LFINIGIKIAKIITNVVTVPAIIPLEYVDDVNVLKIPCHKTTEIIDQLDIFPSQPRKKDPHITLIAQPISAGPSI